MARTTSVRRKNEIINGLNDGLSHREIAKKMKCYPSTVSYYVKKYKLEPEGTTNTVARKTAVGPTTVSNTVTPVMVDAMVNIKAGHTEKLVYMLVNHVFSLEKEIERLKSDDSCTDF